MLGVSAGGGRPLPPRGSGSITPGNFLKTTVQNRAILCKIRPYLCRKSTAKIVLIRNILLADKADSQPNKRQLNFNCLQLQHSNVQSHPRLRRLDETAHRMQRVHLQYRISSNTSRVSKAPFTRYNLLTLSNPLSNRFDNRLYRVNGV